MVAVRTFELLRGAMPAVAVASLVPLALFYVMLTAASLGAAIVASVIYAWGMASWQYSRRRKVSAMLLFTVVTVTVRAVAAVASGHALWYFVVPVLETSAFGLLFVATMVVGEPLIVRLARDLVPHLADDLAERRQLMILLSCLWALVYLGSSTTTLVLLLTQPVPVYLGAHQLTGWLWTGAGIGLSLVVCRWRASGLLRAAVTPRVP
jgi:hypothetical protein